MANQLYHAYQLDAAAPTVYLTKSDGIEPIIQALRERRDSDPFFEGRSPPADSQAPMTGVGSEAPESLGLRLALIPQLILHYGQMLTTMSDVR